jgi:SAM-dependent methyltransferase
MKHVEESYRLQAKSEDDMALPSRYTAPDSVDNWRHTRMLNSTRPLVATYPKATWVTVGDGRYGSDAAYLHSRGAAVTATTLTDERLRIAHERGFIPAYQAENAERMSFPDESVDFVLCKEAYHHFPRPPVALYEMLRVARRAVVLIEPIDNPRLLDAAKRLVKRLIRGDRETQFEPSGNFLYRLSLHEMEKLMTAIGEHTIAFKGINDFYHPRFAALDATSMNIGSSVSRLGIAVQDALSACGLLGFGLGCVIIFRAEPDEMCISSLLNAGFRMIQLPRNPYVS